LYSKSPIASTKPAPEVDIDPQLALVLELKPKSPTAAKAKPPTRTKRSDVTEPDALSVVTSLTL